MPLYNLIFARFAKTALEFLDFDLFHDKNSVITIELYKNKSMVKTYTHVLCVYTLLTFIVCFEIKDKKIVKKNKQIN